MTTFTAEIPNDNNSSRQEAMQLAKITHGNPGSMHLLIELSSKPLGEVFTYEELKTLTQFKDTTLFGVSLFFLEQENYIKIVDDNVDLEKTPIMLTEEGLQHLKSAREQL